MASNARTRAQWHAALIVCAVLAQTSPSRADRSSLPRVAVLDVRTIGNFDPKEVAALSSLAASEVGRYTVRVFAGADLEALLGFEKQKALIGCTDGSCLAEISGALGVDYLLSFEVGQVGKRWLLTATLMSVAKATAIQRATRTSTTQEELVDVVRPVIEEALEGSFQPRSAKTGAPRAAVDTAKPVATKELDESAVAPAKEDLKQAEPKQEARVGSQEPAANSAEPAGRPGVDTTEPAVKVNTQVTSGGTQRAIGWTLVALGGASILGGATAGTYALLEHNQGPPTDPGDNRASRIATAAHAADGLFIAGGVVAATGLIVALTAASSGTTGAAGTPTTPIVTFEPRISGGALIVSGGF